MICSIEVYRDRFGVEPNCRALSEHGMPIAPSTYYSRRAQPVSDRDWADAHMAHAVLDLYRAYLLDKRSYG
jgi:hypothetical protein